jgi:hypothetical protein
VRWVVLVVQCRIWYLNTVSCTHSLSSLFYTPSFFLSSLCPLTLPSPPHIYRPPACYYSAGLLKGLGFKPWNHQGPRNLHTKPQTIPGLLAHHALPIGMSHACTYSLCLLLTHLASLVGPQLAQWPMARKVTGTSSPHGMHMLELRFLSYS